MYAEGQFLAREQYLDAIGRYSGIAPGLSWSSELSRTSSRSRSNSQLEMAADPLKVTIRLLKVTAEMPEVALALLRVMAEELKVSNPRCSNFSTKSTRPTARESRRLITY